MSTEARVNEVSIDRLSIWLSFTKFILGSFVLGATGILINSEFQSRELSLKEQEHLATFTKLALHEDVGVRRKLAQYFATVTQSDKLRSGWERYEKIVSEEFELTKQRELVKAEEVSSIKEKLLVAKKESKEKDHLAQLLYTKSKELEDIKNKLRSTPVPTRRAEDLPPLSIAALEKTLVLQSAVNRVSETLLKDGKKALKEASNYRYEGQNFVFLMDEDLRIILHPIKRRLNNVDLKEKETVDISLYENIRDKANLNPGGAYLYHLNYKPGEEYPSKRLYFFRKIPVDGFSREIIVVTQAWIDSV